MSVGFYFDMSRCTGCRACQVACKDRNRLDVGTIFRNAKTYSVGQFPAVKAYSVSTSCNHCESPACVANCPTGAMQIADDGTVVHDDEMCIGCEACVNACPYDVPKLLPSEIVGKCDGCYSIRQNGGIPSCVGGCATRSLDFGDVDELKEKYGPDLVTEITVWPDGGTGSNTQMKTKQVALETNPTEIRW